MRPPHRRQTHGEGREDAGLYNPSSSSSASSSAAKTARHPHAIPLPGLYDPIASSTDGSDEYHAADHLADDVNDITSDGSSVINGEFDIPDASLLGYHSLRR